MFRPFLICWNMPSNEEEMYLSRFFVSRKKRCKDFSANTAQEKGDRRKRTSDWARTRDLHSFAELQPHEPSVPAANPSSPIALCTGTFSPVAFLLSSVCTEVFTKRCIYDHGIGWALECHEPTKRSELCHLRSTRWAEEHRVILDAAK